MSSQPATATSPAASPAASPRAWRNVLEHIETDLLEGRLAPGDHLPPERDLAARLGVGRSSVREALRVLEVLGLLRTGTGSGPTSGAVVTATPRGGMSALLRLQVAANGFPIADVVNTRLILETAVMAALSRDSDRSTADARAIADAMDQTGLTVAEFLALDAQLHVALAEASGNLVISAMMAGLRTAIESYVLDRAAEVSDWDATADRLRGEHRAILDAVDAGDADRAQRLVTEHITGYYAGLTRT